MHWTGLRLHRRSDTHPTPLGEIQRVTTLRPFIGKVVFFSASLAALLLGIDLLITSFTRWSDYEDPRTRILWNGGFDGSPVVLLGNSVFASLYVNSLDEALWARLEAYSGQRVFPGALNGARPGDILAAAAYVSREWPGGTTVFISLSPTQFVSSRAPERFSGNYADVFLMEYGVDAGGQGTFRSLRPPTYHWLLRPFFANRARRAMANLIDRPRHPGWWRDRVWTQELEVPMKRYELFERHLIIGQDPRPFAWVAEIQARLDRAGLRPVFVLTPLNEALVRRYSTRYPADTVLRELRRTTDTVKAFLALNRANVSDLRNELPDDCFFDLVHPNGCGNDRMAMRLAKWLERSTTISR